MKKLLLAVTLFVLSLVIFSTGCSNNNSEILAQRAKVNLNRADFFQSQIDNQFQQINNVNNRNINQEKVDKCTKLIFSNSNKAQGRINTAISNTREARELTDSYQLKAFYDMKIHAYIIKKEMAKKSSIYARDIKNTSKNKQKTEIIVSKYQKMRNRQQKNYNLLIKRAEDFMELKRA